MAVGREINSIVLGLLFDALDDWSRGVGSRDREDNFVARNQVLLALAEARRHAPEGEIQDLLRKYGFRPKG